MFLGVQGKQYNTLLCSVALSGSCRHPNTRREILAEYSLGARQLAGHLSYFISIDDQNNSAPSPVILILQMIKWEAQKMPDAMQLVSVEGWTLLMANVCTFQTPWQPHYGRDAGPKPVKVLIRRLRIPE